MKYLNLTRLGRSIMVIGTLSVLAACGDIVRPGDTATRAESQPTVVLSTPALAPTSVPAAGGQPIPPLPANAQVTTTPSGLKFADTEAGSDPVVKSGDMVRVFYTGYLADGTVFDSLTSGDPFTLTVGKGEVIQGWDEGLVGMGLNSKRRLIIPAELGYGATGAGGVIPPNAELTFDVQVVGIEPQP